MKNRTVKRVLALAVTAALAGSMVACGGGDGAQSEGSQEETASQEERLTARSLRRLRTRIPVPENLLPERLTRSV